MKTTAKAAVAGTAHQVTSDGLQLYVWEKRAAATRAGTAVKVALLVHGGTYGGRTDYDIQAADGKSSMMGYLAERGWDVFTFDIRGYGRSEKPEDGFSVTTEAAVRDIGAVVDAIRELRRAVSVDLFGWSWGGSTTALYAMANPRRVRRLVMFAGGAGQPGPAARAPSAAPLEPWVVSTRETVVARIEQDVVIPEAQEAFIESVLKWDAKSPNGLRRQVVGGGQAPRPAPERITVPTMIIYGARDSAYQPESVSGFFAGLNTRDKALVVVPDAGHFLIIQNQRMRLFTAVEQWFGYA